MLPRATGESETEGKIYNGGWRRERGRNNYEMAKSNMGLIQHTKKPLLQKSLFVK